MTAITTAGQVAAMAEASAGQPLGEATIITGSGHVVRWVDARPDYTTRSETGQILAALDGAGQ
jgi:hypothetical protein